MGRLLPLTQNTWAKALSEQLMAHMQADTGLVWHDIFPFSPDQTVRCALTAAGLTLTGRVTVRSITETLLALSFAFPAQRVLFKRTPGTEFDLLLDHRQDGAGNRTELVLRAGVAPASGRADGLGKPQTDETARFVTRANPPQRRIETTGTDGRPLGFTLRRAGKQAVEVVNFAGPRVLPGLRMRIG